MSDLPNVSDLNTFTYVDLFSGCGGLSLGLRRAGGQLIAAVEKSEMAAQTYAANFLRIGETKHDWEQYLSKPITEQASSKLIVSPLRNVLDSGKVMDQLRSASVDLVAGGPPCQGFSLAGRRDQNDLRNKLAWEFLEMVEQLAPKVVLIENVVGMNHTFEKGKSSSFKQLQEALRQTGIGYKVQGLAVNAIHFGAPQHRPRMMILGIRNDQKIAEQINEKILWKSSFSSSFTSDDYEGLFPETISSDSAVTIADAIGDLQFSNLFKENFESTNTFREQVQTKVSWGLPPEPHIDKLAFSNHIPRKHNPTTVTRFRIYQWLKCQGLSSRLLSDHSHGSIEELIGHLKSANFPAKSPDGTLLGDSPESMASLMQLHRTKKHSQSALSWNESARTVVTLPDDYVHPSEPRIFTVRELARFQGFPDDFIYYGKETTGSTRRRVEVPQYSQVGNAVSPFLGYAMGKLVATSLNSE